MSDTLGEALGARRKILLHSLRIRRSRSMLTHRSSSFGASDGEQSGVGTGEVGDNFLRHNSDIAARIGSISGHWQAERGSSVCPSFMRAVIALTSSLMSSCSAGVSVWDSLCWVGWNIRRGCTNRVLSSSILSVINTGNEELVCYSLVEENVRSLDCGNGKTGFLFNRRVIEEKPVVVNFRVGDVVTAEE
jgi:hypothetical protein